jgi:DNA-directed RNA polymerase specialized sigma24 family protein
MKKIPGTLQEGGARFETTHWTVVMQSVKSDASVSAQEAMAEFCESYWPPLYTFVRRRGYSPSDAQDLVQGFFEHLLSHNTLSRADRDKGRLRTFLLGSLQNFLANEYDRTQALKRGGRVASSR